MAKYKKKLEDDIRCPLEYGLAIFGGKWKSRIICVLSANERLRYSELRKEMYNITDAVLAAGSPREVLRESFKAELISDEAWMKMLRVRNELAHDYDGEIVKEHCDAIIGTYIDLFYEFENTVKELNQ